MATSEDAPWYLLGAPTVDEAEQPTGPVPAVDVYGYSVTGGGDANGGGYGGGQAQVETQVGNAPPRHRAVPAQVQSAAATPLSGIPTTVHVPHLDGPTPTGMARLYTEAPQPLVTLRGRSLTSDIVWHAIVADAVTGRPNEVVLDLTEAPVEAARPLRHALRAVAAWPHPPVIVVADEHSPIARSLARLGPATVDVVSSVAVARSIVTARRWVPGKTRTLHPPLISQAIARAEVLAAAATGHLLSRVDAAMTIVGELVSRALDTGAPTVQLRFAADDSTMGVAVAWAHSPTSTTHQGLEDADDRNALLATLADAHGSHVLPGHSVAWAVLHRTPVELLSR